MSGTIHDLIERTVDICARTLEEAEIGKGEILREGALGYVQKPYDIDALARMVRQALEKAPQAAAPSLPKTS